MQSTFQKLTWWGSPRLPYMLATACHVTSTPFCPILAQTFPDVLRRLEPLAGWKTRRIRPPVLILGHFDGIDGGIRQLRRDAPLETETIEGVISRRCRRCSALRDGWSSRETPPATTSISPRWRISWDTGLARLWSRWIDG